MNESKEKGNTVDQVRLRLPMPSDKTQTARDFMPEIEEFREADYDASKRRIGKRGALAGVLVALLLGVTAGPAAANHIETTYYSDNDTSIVTDWCDFPITFTGVGAYKQIDYYDNQDRLVKSTFTADAGPYHFIVSANGVTLQTNSAYKAWFFYDQDGNLIEYRENGEIFAFTAPSKGVVFLLTGHAIQDVQTGETTFAAGPRGEDFSNLCAALS